MRSEQRHQNFTNTLDRLLELGAMPIINENDTVATDEIGIGDNDTLAAIVAKSVSADLLVLLSDIDGLYTADPHKDPDAVLIRHVAEINDEIRALAGVSGSGLGSCGCTMVIANGENSECLYDILDGKDVGTRFSKG